MARARMRPSPKRPKVTRSTESSAASALEARLGRYRGWICCLIIVAALMVRGVYFFQVHATPFMQLHEWAQSDMHYFDSWAQQVARGDWLSRSVQVPMHRWHRETAQHYLAKHPETGNSLRAGTTPPDTAADTAIWSTWMQTPRFYQDPLYPYLLAATYLAAGHDPRYVFAWQMLLGVAAVLLIWRLTAKYFGELAGILSAGLAILTGPFLFYELLLLRESLIASVSLGLVWLIDHAFTRGTLRAFSILGAALGISILLKGTFALVTVGVAGAVIWFYAREGQQWRTALAGLVIGTGLGLAPLAARNIAVGVSPMSLASSGPLTFVTANGRDALPDVGFGINTATLATFLGETGGGWRDAFALVSAEHSVSTYMPLLVEKWRRIWHWYDIPNNENIYYMRVQAGVLRWLPITFWTAGVLGLVGIGLAAPRWRAVWPLYLVLCASIVPLLAFYVLARFRLPVLALLLPFASHTLIRWSDWIRRGRRVPSAVMAVCVLLIGLWTGSALSQRQVEIRVADWIVAYSAHYQSRVYAALDAGDPQTAGRWYLEFFERYEPDAGTIARSGNRSLALELADMHRECAQILAAAGQTELAEGQLADARRLMSVAGK